MRFCTLNVRSLSGQVHLQQQPGNWLGLVSVQEVMGDREGTERAGIIIFLWKGDVNHQLGRGSFVHHRIVTAVKKVEFISDRMSYIVLRGRRCDIIELNVKVPSEEKSDDTKDSFYEELDQGFLSPYENSIRKFNAKVRRENIFKPTIGNENLHQDSNDNAVRIVNFATSKF